jgi:hypothetical protein
MRAFKVTVATPRDIDILVRFRHEMFEDMGHRTAEEHRVNDVQFRRWALRKMKERKLQRSAEVGSERYPVTVRSYAARLSVEGVRLDVYGDVQIKVGDWDWGDTLEFEPEFSHVVDVRIPVFPLRLKSELYLGLGWTDRASKISEAMARAHHGFSKPVKSWE